MFVKCRQRNRDTKTKTGVHAGAEEGADAGAADGEETNKINKTTIMESNITKYQNDLNSLIKKGDDLLYGLYHEFSEELKLKISKLDKEQQDRIKKCYFRKNYNSWYNESLALISQLMPSRYDDFVSFYKQPQRKEFNYGTYTISR